MSLSRGIPFALICLVWAVGSLVVHPDDARAAAVVEYSFPHSPASWSAEGSWVKHSSPIIADLDPPAANGPEIAVGSLDGWLYVLRPSGGKLVRVWSADLGTMINSSPAVADLDGDGLKEILVGAGDTQRPPGSGVHVFAHDSRKLGYWPTPDAPGLPNGVFATPAVGDVTGDGRPNVVFGSFNHRIYVKDAGGADVPGWEGGKFVYDTVWSSPALADVNGDGRLEIVIGSDLGGGGSVFGCTKAARGMVSIFDGGGSFLPGWPKCMDTPIWSSPAVVDVNGDGVLDVIVGTNNYLENGTNVGEPWKVHAFSADGRSLWSTPLRPGSRIFTSPAVGDVTDDGRPEVAIGTIEGTVGSVYLLDAATGAILWGRDDGGSGECCVFMGSPVLADVSGDGVADVVAAGGDWAVHAWSGDGERLFRTPLGGAMFNSPAVADVHGDGRNEIVAASSGIPGDPNCSHKCGKVFVVDTAGTGMGPWPMFRRDAVRVGAVGVGRLPGAPPPPPAPASKPRAPSPSREPAAVVTTDAPPPSPTAEPEEEKLTSAIPLDEERSNATSARWAALAAAIASAGAAVAGRGILRRRRQIT